MSAIGMVFLAIVAINILLIIGLLVRQLAKDGLLDAPIRRILRMWETATNPKLIETVSIGIVITGLGTATLLARSLYDVMSGILAILVGLYMTSVAQEKRRQNDQL